MWVVEDGGLVWWERVIVAMTFDFLGRALRIFFDAQYQTASPDLSRQDKAT